jgi:hypothetical protein
VSWRGLLLWPLPFNRSSLIVVKGNTAAGWKNHAYASVIRPYDGRKMELQAGLRENANNVSREIITRPAISSA